MTFTDYEVVQPTDEDWMLTSFVEVGAEIVGRQLLCNFICDEVGRYTDGKSRYDRPRCRLLRDGESENEAILEYSNARGYDCANENPDCGIAIVKEMTGPGIFNIQFSDGRTERAFVTSCHFERYDDNEEWGY